MSLGVGLPMMKLKNGGSGTKTSMPLRKACREAGTERASKSKTLDLSRSGRNFAVRVGIDMDKRVVKCRVAKVPSGEEMAEFFETRAAEYSEQRVRNGGKALRKDAPIAATFIMKPTAEQAAQWDEETRDKWIVSSLTAWCNVWGHAPDYAIVHMDEAGPHIHVFDRMRDANGDYRMSKVVTRGKLCEWHDKYVKWMRKQGFDVKVHDRTNEDGSPRMSNENGLSQEDLSRKKAWEAKEAAKREAEEQVLKKRASQLQSREDKLADKEAVQQLKVREFVERANAFERERENAKTQQKRANEAIEQAKAKVARREAEVDERTQALDAREQEVTARERVIEKREQAVTLREKAAAHVEADRIMQMQKVKREVEAYKTEQMERAKSRASEYEKRRKAEVDALVKVEVGHKVKAIDAELDGYRAKKRAAIEDEADEQMKRLHRPIADLMGEVIQKDPLRFMADMLKAVADSCDDEGISNAKGNPVSTTFRNAANRLMELDEYALRDNRNERAFNVWGRAVDWMLNRVKGTIKRDATAPVVPPPAEVYGVSDREDENEFGL